MGAGSDSGADEGRECHDEWICRVRNKVALVWSGVMVDDASLLVGD